jgi:hypothetical protein
MEEHISRRSRRQMPFPKWNTEEILFKTKMSVGRGAHAYYSSYFRGGGRKSTSSRSAWVKLGSLYFKTKNTKG